MVLVKNADSQAYPRPTTSLDVGPRGRPEPRPGQSGLTCQLPAQSQLHAAHIYSDCLVSSLPDQLSPHRDALFARVGQSPSPQLPLREKNPF